MLLIRSLNRGGAEQQLTMQARSIDRTRFAVTVVTLQDGGALRSQLEDLEGVTLVSLHKKRQVDIPIAMWRSARMMRRAKPQIVHGYLDVANLLALAAGKPFGAKVVWGIRASDVDFSHYGRKSALLFRICARLSRFADLIITNSQAGKSHHIREGFCRERMLVIPNGFDTAKFKRDRDAGLGLRHVWGIPEHKRVVGLVARLDPMKDHPTFLRAAAQLAKQYKDVHFVCVGGGPATYRDDMRALADELGLEQTLTWAGEFDNMPAAQNTFDVATSSTAFGEGFSNAIGEAMACGVPCVVTDVGDSALLVGEVGLVVPAGDPDALAIAWSRLLDMPAEARRAMGTAARQRIVNEYSLDALARRTEEALVGLLRDGRRNEQSCTN